jgi:MraZ protein
MLLTGTHPRTLDDKKRLTLPKRIREQVGEVTQMFVTPGADQSLWIYTKDELERLSAKLDQTPATDAEARVFRRLFFAQMEEVELDRIGRVLIPDRLVQFAGLEHEVVLLGVRDHLELWNAQSYQAYYEKHSPEFDKVAERAFHSSHEKPM